MGCLSGNTGKVDTTAQDESVRLSRQEFDTFRRDYSHLVPQVTDAANNDSEVVRQVGQASAQVAPAFDSARGVASREASRYNQQTTARQRQLISRRENLGRSRAQVHANNMTRMDAGDLQDSLRADTIALGSGYRRSAMGNYNALAGMEAQRNRQNIDQRASHKASLWGLGGQAAGLASTAVVLSTGKAKQKVAAASKSQAERDIRKLDVKNYEYKDGMGPPGRRTGIIKEDSPQIASQGDAVDMNDQLNKLTLAFQAVADKVDDTGKRVLKLERRRTA